MTRLVTLSMLLTTALAWMDGVIHKAQNGTSVVVEGARLRLYSFSTVTPRVMLTGNKLKDDIRQEPLPLRSVNGRAVGFAATRMGLSPTGRTLTLASSSNTILIANKPYKPCTSGQNDLQSATGHPLRGRGSALRINQLSPAPASSPAVARPSAAESPPRSS